MMDVMPLIAAEPAPNAAVLIGFALLLVGGVIGSILGYELAKMDGT